MGVPATIADLSLTAGDNSPAGTDVPNTNTGPDDYLRAHAAIIKQLAADSGAELAKTDGNFIVGNGTTWVAESGATARASLGLTIGTHVQAYDAQLATLAGITAQQATDLAALSTFMGTVLNDADAATARTTLELATVGQAEAEAGTATTTRAWTAERVAQAIAALSPSPSGTWTDVKTSPGRAIGVTYTNTTGKLIFVNAAQTFGSVGVPTMTIDGVAINGSLVSTAGTQSGYLWPIPAGAEYVLTGGTLVSWHELF